MAAQKRSLSAEEIAAVFDVHVKTVRTWPRDGCPHSKRGKAYAFSEDEVNKWIRDTGRRTTPGRPPEPKSDATVEQEQDKDYWLARKYRIQCLREEGKLIDAGEVQRQWASVAAVTRNRLEMIPAQTAPQCEGRTAVEIQAIFEQRIREALTSLSAAGADEVEESMVLSEPGPA
jgi:phage terminase Nu1 subunit (DNA packaging protein)